MNVGTLVSYASIKSGDVRGKISAAGTDRFGKFVRVTVTVGGNWAYPKGSTFIVSVGARELTAR